MTASAGGPGAKTSPSAPIRLYRATRALTHEQRLTAIAALSLFITMFLPWYSETGLAQNGKNGIAASGVSLSAWSAFGLVQVFVLLVSVGVLALLFARGEGRTFRLPGGDGGNILVFGSFTAVLVFYGVFDKPGGGTLGRVAVFSTGVSWGIFLALFAAAWLAWTGLAMRRAELGGGGGDRGGGAPSQRPERRLTRRERSGGGDVPESARWVEPAAPGYGERPRESQAARRDPPPPADRALRRDDGTQLSFELRHDRFEE